MATEVLRMEPGVYTLRILDGHATTKSYVTIPFVQGDFSGEQRIRISPPSIIRLNRGLIDAYAHVIPGNDQNIGEGVEYTFTYWPDMVTNLTVLAAMSNALEATITTSTWPVGAGTFTSTAGTGAQIYNALGTLVNPIQSADVRHMRVDVEGLQANQIGGTDYGFRFEECHFESIQFSIQATEAPHRVTFRRYGAIVPITAFTTATDLTPSVA